MKHPVELFVYSDEAHDVPVNAWRCDDGVQTVRYLCSDLKCDDCYGLSDPEWWCHRECGVSKVDRPACMAFVAR